MRRKAAWLSLFAVLIWAGLAFGQARTGSIYGTVTDSDGNPLPGVTVTATSDVTAAQSVVTDIDGSYRFPSLPPGTFTLRFELEGFKTVVRENIEVRVGVNARIDVTMAPGGGEEVVVTGGVPVVDVKSTTVRANLSKEELQALPTARDPWVILELAPGVMVDRENVGGSESGQQSIFTGRGAGSDENQWNMDGLTITDPAAIGASPMYYDFDAFEEMQIQTGGNDIEVLSGGVTINFVTRRAGNKITFGGRFYLTDDSLGSDNVKCVAPNPDGSCSQFETNGGEELLRASSRGNKVANVKDFGGNIGGPLIKDKLWFWGAYGGQRIDLLVPTAPVPAGLTPPPTFDPNEQAQHDKTQLDDITTKLNAQFGKHMTEFFFIWSNKKKQGRGASPTRPPETTWNQKGPSPLFKLQDEFFASDNLFLSFKAGLSLLGFQLDPQGQGIAVRDTSRVWHNSYLFYKTDRPTWQLTGQAIYYKSDWLGGDHEIKLGAEFRRSNITSQTGFPNGEAYIDLGGGLIFGGFIFNGESDYWKQRFSAYLQDTFTSGRLTLNLGLRFDVQNSGFNSITTSAPNAKVAQFVAPEISVTSGDLYTWTTLSPRIGLTYDITGDARTLFKASFAIYPSEYGVGETWLEGTTLRDTLFLFIDGNGDKIFDPAVDTFLFSLGNCGFLAGPPFCDENFNNVHTFDNVNAPQALEVTVGFERELMPDLGIGLTGFYRRNYNFNWRIPVEPAFGLPDDRSCFQPVDAVPSEFPVDGDPNLYLCGDDPSQADQWLFTQRPGVHTEYFGLELRFTKRMSHHWMLQGSGTIQTWTQNLGKAGVLDPTNLPQVDNGQAFESTGGSGKTNIFVNARWMVKAGLVYQAPFDINLGATFVAREGYILLNQYDFGFICDITGCGDRGVLLNEVGDDRLPTFWQLNLRLEKLINLGEYGRLYLAIDGFNIFNNDIALGRWMLVNDDGFGKITEVSAPRVFRVGARYEF